MESNDLIQLRLNYTYLIDFVLSKGESPLTDEEFVKCMSILKETVSEHENEPSISPKSPSEISTIQPVAKSIEVHPIIRTADQPVVPVLNSIQKSPSSLSFAPSTTKPQPDRKQKRNPVKSADLIIMDAFSKVSSLSSPTLPEFSFEGTIVCSEMNRPAAMATRTLSEKLPRFEF